jgi:hypothetical protein
MSFNSLSERVDRIKREINGFCVRCVREDDEWERKQETCPRVAGEISMDGENGLHSIEKVDRLTMKSGPSNASLLLLVSMGWH